ncbi:MAG: nucleotide exchange factor GrpE [Pseudomonadota bacterium]
MTDDVQSPTPEEAPAAADPAAALAAAVTEITELNEQLAFARKEASEATLRAQAELQNVRKRLERDAENSRKFALEKFAAGLLPVVDSLERGLAAVTGEDEAAKAAREGMALTLKLFKDTLRKFEVEEIDPKGQAFNPQFHEAVAHVPNGDVAPNTVIDVMQKGFQLAGRLLRPAMVVVSRAP